MTEQVKNLVILLPNTRKEKQGTCKTESRENDEFKVIEPKLVYS